VGKKLRLLTARWSVQKVKSLEDEKKIMIWILWTGKAQKWEVSKMRRKWIVLERAAAMQCNMKQVGMFGRIDFDDEGPKCVRWSEKKIIILRICFVHYNTFWFLKFKGNRFIYLLCILNVEFPFKLYFKKHTFESLFKPLNCICRKRIHYYYN